MTQKKSWWDLVQFLTTTLVIGTAISFGLLTVPRWTAQAEDPFLRRTATVRAAERVGPAVVNITTERIVQTPNPFASMFNNPNFDRFFRDFGGPQQQKRTVDNLGSGFIFDHHGHVLTNAHVVNAANRVTASLSDGREFEARLIGADPNNDLAVLKIETDERLPWVAPGSSADLMVGEPVIAIGNPFGLENTVTTGVISATDRSVRANDQQHFFHGFIQTDAAINPGNSGGPLLNAEGSPIGINTAVYGGQGIGFAIPIDTARRVVDELLEHGEVVPVWLGIEFQNLDPSLREVMRLPEGLSGALVSGVRRGSPASEAGIQRGDIITSFENRPLSEARRFFEMLATVTPDQALRIEIWRDSAVVEVTVVARKFPDAYVIELARSMLGTQLSERSQAGYRVAKVRTDSAAARAGIQRGDIVVRIGGQILTGPDEFRRAVLGLRGKYRALLVVERGGRHYPVTVSLL